MLQSNRYPPSTVPSLENLFLYTTSIDIGMVRHHADQRPRTGRNKREVWRHSGDRRHSGSSIVRAHAKHLRHAAKAAFADDMRH